jgi:hypothetical protein
MNLLLPEGMAVLCASWNLDGFSPYIETFLEWTVEFRSSLGICKAVSDKTHLTLLRDAEERPWSPDTKPEEIHIALLGADRA